MPPKTTGRKAKRTNDEIYDLMMQQNAEMREYMVRNESRFEKWDKTAERVNGNGKPGLVQEMALVQEREAKRDRREWFISTVLAVEIVGLIFTLIK